MRYNPLLVLLILLPMAVLGLKVSDSVYRYFAYGSERAQVKTLRGQLVDAGAQIVRTKQASDSMRAVMRQEDQALESEQHALRRYDVLARDGALPQDTYERYRAELARYNSHVTSRNAKLSVWQDILARNHAAVSRYNVLADSVRDLATRMGDPYFAVPSPAEAAAERGIVLPETP